MNKLLCLIILACILFYFYMTVETFIIPIEKAKVIENSNCDIILKPTNNTSCHVKSLVNSNRMKTLGGNFCYLDNDPSLGKQDPMLKQKKNKCSLSDPIFRNNRMFSKIENRVTAGFGDKIYSQKCVIQINPNQVTEGNVAIFNKALEENDHESCRKTYGLQFAIYNGYYNDNLSWFKGKNPMNTGFTNDFRNLSLATNKLITGHGRSTISVQWNGFYNCLRTGLHQFVIGSDDASYLWLGYNAFQLDRENALINNGGLHSMRWRSAHVHLIKGEVYPIRIIYGENYGSDRFKMFFKLPNSNHKYWHDQNGRFFIPFPRNMDEIRNIPREGFKFFVYNGYFADRTEWFENKKYTHTGYSNDMRNLSLATARYNGLGHSKHEYFSVQWLGFFRAHQTGKHRFETISDDASYFWIGHVALRGYNQYNAQVKNGNAHGRRKRHGFAHLEAGKTYPIRMQYGERTGANNFTFICIEPNTNKHISHDTQNRYFLPPKDDIEVNDLKTLIWTTYKGLPASFYS